MFDTEPKHLVKIQEEIQKFLESDKYVLWVFMPRKSGKTYLVKTSTNTVDGKTTTSTSNV